MSISWRKVGIGVGAVVLVALVGVVYWCWGDTVLLRTVFESPSQGSCERRLGRKTLKKSIELGTTFLLRHQKREGNFDYQYDWRDESLSEDDNEVRQAGAVWALALLYQNTPTPKLRAALDRGLQFFERHSVAGPERSRCIAYGTEGSGATGTVALLALTYVDYLRAGAGRLPENRIDELERELSEYVKHLVRSVDSHGQFHANYDTKTCKPIGDPSPYYDGEALLALVKAAKYTKHEELWPTIERTAAATRRANVEAALEENSDSEITKGFYQWGTMAYFELATSERANMKAYGDTVLKLGDWIIEDHDILYRARNTAYAYEGLAHSYEMARLRNDAERVAKYGCTIDVGLHRLLTWQAGGPLANRYARGGKRALAKGGVQNGATDAALRIDVTQHQMHATLLAQKYVYSK